MTETRSLIGSCPLERSDPLGGKAKPCRERRGEYSGEPKARDEGEAEACLGRGGDRAAVLPCPTQNGKNSGRAVAKRIRPKAASRRVENNYHESHQQDAERLRLNKRAPLGALNLSSRDQ